MKGIKEYKFAVALMNFKKAFEEMADASKAVPNYDTAERYPFYLLDYEAIEPAVGIWCRHHAQKIVRELPDEMYEHVMSLLKKEEDNDNSRRDDSTNQSRVG